MPQRPLHDIAPLIDGLGRAHTNLRLSVTDRCNIRCTYCMPEEVLFRPRAELLTFEEMTRFVEVVSQLGIVHLRITGGEPLVRRELPRLISLLAAIDGIQEIALTTNGVLLAEQALALKDAGLARLNVSLDTLHREVFERITRRDVLDRVLDGIETAQRVGFERIRINAVPLQGLSEEEIVPLARFARARGLELRFIEFMPLDGDGVWQAEDVLSGARIREILQTEIGTLEPVPRTNPSQPAVDYQFEDGTRIGLINSVTEPFCATCNRLRITADGQVRNCLFSLADWDARRLMREGGSDDQLADLVRACVAAKMPAHGIGAKDFVRPDKAMYQIGG